ncbi:MAG: hypothetical protein ACYS0H_02635 [Planctomycetota bacterium]|jgi:hypothetical protein
MLRVSLILLVVPALATVASASDDEIFNVDFFCGWGGHYRPMEWTPVEIGISSVLTEPFGGSVTLAAQQDGLNTMNVTYDDFVLTPDMPRNLPLVTKLTFAVDKCTITIRNERGREKWRREYNLWDYSTGNRLLTSVGENDLLIGLVGSGGFGLRRLDKETVCQSGQNPRGTSSGKVYLGHKLPRMVPWDWTGFVPLDLLVLYDPDWGLFREQQLKAIVEWVSNGGRLLVVLGTNPLSPANPLAQFLPFELQDVKQVAISQRILEQWSLMDKEPETVSAWPLVPKSGARYYEAATYDIDKCLFATGCAGFGRVSVLAFDPATMSDEQAARSAQFWVSCIKTTLGDDPRRSRNERRSRTESRRIVRTIEYSGDVTKDPRNNRRFQGQFNVGNAHTANNFVMEFLYQGVKPLSIWWVILLLTLLAVLLGPVDYKLLKRKDRLPLTWVTCTFWIALFTVGAYYGVQAIRGGDLELRVVSVIDGIEGDDHTWSTDYCGLFAPYSDDYRLSGLQEDQWWSGIAPTQQSIWQGRQEVAGRRIYCFQHDGGNIPYSLPINIWTVQCLLNESPVDKLPFSAEVRPEGDEFVVKIVNEADSPISDAFVLVDNERGVNLGRVPAGDTREFRRKSTNIRFWAGYDQGRFRSSYPRGRRHTGTFRNNDAFFAQGCLQRTRAMSDYLTRGAAVVCAEYKQAPVSFTVKGHSCKPTHVQLARLVVFPKEQREETAND